MLMIADGQHVTLLGLLDTYTAFNVDHDLLFSGWRNIADSRTMS